LQWSFIGKRTIYPSAATLFTFNANCNLIDVANQEIANITPIPPLSPNTNNELHFNSESDIQ
jgi:hypothetical protein